MKLSGEISNGIGIVQSNSPGGSTVQWGARRDFLPRHDVLLTLRSTFIIRIFSRKLFENCAPFNVTSATTIVTPIFGQNNFLYH